MAITELKAKFLTASEALIHGDLHSDAAVASAVRHFGGLDIVVANAGLFPPSAKIEALSDEVWDKTLSVNLTSQMYLFRAAAPYLTLGIDPTIVVVASKNVAAPGPGAAAYSASKAGMTQLARVAALELGPKGVRINMVHPHAVMDTALWTPEILNSRAAHYGMSVEDYKRNKPAQGRSKIERRRRARGRHGWPAVLEDDRRAAAHRRR
ncbi:MAG TPA: SDR family NAD(P)-dependent oxidoreductase [Polyangiaceae bacterium]|nr:SDR family NAD(P)-dependent oxidoreductase [Polyangiaceae bacterium]